MSTVTATNYLEIIEQLAPERPVVFRNVSWDEYEQLLEDLGERPGVHVSFDEGVLEIMPISTEHNYYAEMLQNLARFAAIRLKIKLRTFGDATIKKSAAGVGKEPDGCYYIKSLALIGKKILLDFEHDPPPDIALEIDLSTDSISKLPIYRRLGIAEVWLYDGYELTIQRLGARGYKPIKQSLELPGFTSELLTEFLHASQSPDDENQLLEEYVERIVRAQPSA